MAWFADLRAPPMRVASLVAVALILSACPDARPPNLSEPVGTVRTFLDAVSREDCDAAFALFSRATRENITAEVKRAAREATYESDLLVPARRYCRGTYGDIKTDSVMLKQETADDAVVEAVQASGTRFPIIPFLSDPYRESPTQLQLVREDGGWRIERQLARLHHESHLVVDVGDVEVTHHLGGDPNRELMRADLHFRGSRDALFAVLRDPARWPKLLPVAQNATVLDGDVPAGEARVSLRFGMPGRTEAPEALLIVKPYGHLRDPKLPWAKLQFSAKPGAGRLSMVSGTWAVRPYHDRFIVELSLVVEPREWPAGFAEEILRPESIAGAVTGLVAEAQR
jgi:hypothetical protein